MITDPVIRENARVDRFIGISMITDPVVREKTPGLIGLLSLF